MALGRAACFGLVAGLVGCAPGPFAQGSEGASLPMDGYILDVGDGGLIGVFAIERSGDLLSVETMHLQRWPSSQPFDVVSQRHEANCSSGDHHIVANVWYRRSGEQVGIVPADTAWGRDGFDPLFLLLCADEHSDNARQRFASIEAFMEISDAH